MTGRLTKCGGCSPRGTRRGFTLVEVMVVVTITAVLAAMCVPSFQRSMEQARADIAGAELRAIWAAERLYWQEYRTYCSSLSTLQSLGLIDPAITTAKTPYVFAIDVADAQSFSASATRFGSTKWIGKFSLDQGGTMTGSIKATKQRDIVPGFQ